MKKTLINFSISFLIIFILSVFLILLISLLTINNILPYSIGEQIIYSASVLFFFTFAFLFSKKQKRHGFLRGAFLGILYFLLAITLSSRYHVGTPIFLQISKSVSLLFGSVVGVNFARD